MTAIPSYPSDSEVVAEAEAESEVVALFEDAGLFVVDLGGLREGGQMQQVRAPRADHNLIRLP